MKKDFTKIQKENTNLSSLICFIKVCYLKKWKKGEIRRGFNELVSTKDYEPESKAELLEYLYSRA